MSERSLVGDAVAGFFGDRCTPEDVAAIEAGGDAQPLWDEVEDLGFTLVSVPESAGGPGGSLVDALTVLRWAGRHAVPLPLAETGPLAGWILASAGLEVEAGMTTIAPVRPDDVLRVVRDGTATRLVGTARHVPWGAAAGTVVALARDDDGSLWAARVPRADVRATPGRNLAGEPRDRLAFDTVVAADSIAPLPHGFDEAMLRGALARSVQMLGALERTRDLTVGWSKDREQFGRPIARFQAVQHMLAQMARDVALTRAAVELAASAALDGGDAWLEIAAAKVLAGRAAHTVSAQAHQVHGAIGVTREYSLSIMTRRLWAWRDEFGAERMWARQLGQRVYASPGGVWELVTAGRTPLGTVRTA